MNQVCYFCGSPTAYINVVSDTADVPTGYKGQLDVCEDCDEHLESLINFSLDIPNPFQ